MKLLREIRVKIRPNIHFLDTNLYFVLQYKLCIIYIYINFTCYMYIVLNLRAGEINEISVNNYLTNYHILVTRNIYSRLLSIQTLVVSIAVCFFVCHQTRCCSYFMPCFTIDISISSISCAQGLSLCLCLCVCVCVCVNRESLKAHILNPASCIPRPKSQSTAVWGDILLML